VSEILTPQNGETPSDGRPALVLDTNTVLALWMFRDPALDVLREWIEAWNCRLYSREDALEELRRVLAYRQFGLDEVSQQAIIAGYRLLLTPWDPPKDRSTAVAPTLLPRCRDADDQKFLEIAVQLGATHLLTRDKALLKLARHRTIRERFAILPPERLIGTTLSTSAVPR
jgi:predicted nucleic acid-binding protein